MVLFTTSYYFLFLGSEFLHIIIPPSLSWSLPHSVAAGCFFDLSISLQTLMPDTEEMPDSLNDSQWGYSIFGDNELSNVIVAILRASQRYNERSDRQKILNAQLFEGIPIVWRNVPAIKKVEVKCQFSKVHAGNNSTFFDVHISNPIFNEAVNTNINNIVEALKLGYDCKETDVLLCCALLQLQRIINFLKDESEVSKPTLKTELFNYCDGITSFDKSKLGNYGIQWLFALIDLEREEVFNYPPTKELLSFCISNLAYFVPKGIGTYPLQESLLRKMIEHPKLITKLAHVFSPNDNGLNLKLLCFYFRC